MSTTTTYNAEQEALFAAYTRTTNTWGRITLFAGFVIATSVPFIVLATTDLDITFSQIITAFIAVAAVYVWTSLALSGVFRKTGEEPWKAWVPILNTWTVLTLGGQAGWWAVLALVPIVNIVSVVMLVIAIDAITKRFGYGVGFTVLGFFFYPVWASILAWGPAVPARPGGPAPRPPRRPAGGRRAAR